MFTVGILWQAILAVKSGPSANKLKNKIEIYSSRETGLIVKIKNWLKVKLTDELDQRKNGQKVDINGQN